MKRVCLILSVVIGITLFFAVSSISYATQKQDFETSPTQSVFIAERQQLSVQSTNEFTISFGGYLVQSDATEILIKFNNYRVSKGLPALKWDDNEEDYYTDRAAELAVFYSFTRLNGKPGSEFGHGYYTNAGNYANWLLNTESDVKSALDNPSAVSFCAGVFESFDGNKYIAYQIYSTQTGNTSPKYSDDEYLFEIPAKDGYLNCNARFMNSKNYNYNPINLQIGAKYKYWIYNYNHNDNDNQIILETMKTKSSNSNVVSIDKHGTLIAKKPGIANVSVSPAEGSKLIFSKKVVVRPAKVNSIKAKSKKKKKATITWAKQSNVNGYYIYRSTKKNRGFKSVKVIKDASKKSFTDKKLKKGKTYYYKVCSFVSDGKSIYCGDYSSTVKCKIK